MSLMKKEEWVRKLHRLNESLSHVEAVWECMNEFQGRADEWKTPSFRGLLNPMWVHWTAILLRGVFVKGARRYRDVNVSLEGLFEELLADPALFLQLANRDGLEIGLREEPTEARVKAFVTRDLEDMNRESNRLRGYANTIAHLQLGQDKITGPELREAIALARKLINRYHWMLTGEAPLETPRERWVDWVNEDFNRISKGMLGFNS